MKWERHLYWNDFGEAVQKHLRAQGEAEEQPEPLVERDVVVAAAIENGPEGSDYGSEDEQAESLHPIEQLITTAAAGLH
jgi:hypothetical protein